MQSMAETHLPLWKGAGEDLVISDITTAPQYSDLGGSGNRCPILQIRNLKVTEVR